MFKRWINTSSPIGCAIDNRRIRLAQLRGRGGGLMVASRELPAQLPPDDDSYRPTVLSLLKEMLSSTPFEGQRVVSCIPLDWMVYWTVRMPASSSASGAAMDEEELTQAARWKTASELGLKPESLLAAIIPLGTVAEGDKQLIEAATVGADIARLEQHVRILSEAGLEPVAIDCSTCAALRCVTATCGAADGPLVLLELADNCSTILVMNHERPVLLRSVRAGTGYIDQLLADMLSISREDALRIRAGETTDPRELQAIEEASCLYARELARELSLSMRRVKQSLTTATAVPGMVVASDPLDAKLLLMLRQLTGIAFHAPEFAPGPQWHQDLAALEQDSTGWITPVGLAMYEQADVSQAEAA